MRFRLSEWTAAGAIFLVVFLTLSFWGWRYLRLERTALAAVDPEMVRPPTEGPAQPEAITEPVALAAPPEPQVFFVHVAGAVQNPGVYQLAEGARVFEAVNRAGGPTDEAALERINLAQPIQDGVQIYVPVKGDEGAPMVAAAPTVTSPAAASAGGAVKVDINRAPSAELQRIPGIGPALAERIIRYRETNGPFRTVEDLVKVSGIGAATLEKMRPYAVVSR